MKPSIRSLPVQLFTVLALPLLVLLMLVTFGSITLHRAAMLDLATEHDAQAVRGVAEILSARLESEEETLTTIVRRAMTNPNTQASLEAWTETRFDGGIAIYDSQNQRVAAASGIGEWHTSGPLRSELQEALDEVRPAEVIYIPLIKQGSNATSIAIVASTMVEDETMRVIGILSLDALDLPILLETIRSSEHASITLATKKGLIIYHTNPSFVGSYLPDMPYAYAAQRGETDTGYYADTSSERIVSFAPVPEPSWTLIQEESWTEMLSPLMRSSQSAPLVLIPGLTIAMLGAWFAINAMVRPLQRLETRAADLASGNFDTIQEPVGGIENIRRLQGSLQRMAGQLAKAQGMMRHYIHAITQAQEDERRRLARELHDQMIQSMIALDHREQVLRRYLNDDPAGVEVLTDLREMTAQAIDDLRRIIRAMRPIYLEDLGLLPALEALARDVSAAGDADVHFEKVGTPRRLPAEQEITLYRVAQEALNNARRHSNATAIYLSVRFDAEEVTVSVRDNGVGFNAPRRVMDLPRNGHFGLIGMYERAELAGANLNIRSTPGEGTTITIRANTVDEAVAVGGNKQGG